ncbi:maltose O-acetyltransferase [mine drainage metagenome]|uniref:Maltose O-acetyltransferase n=1 Tax=mine drainage metagenome TaxID=410659 RepID=A0A1J5QQS8_9ZZZZ
MTLRNALKWLAVQPIVPTGRRWRLLAAAGVDAREVGFESGVQIHNHNISIGRGSYVNRDVLFEGSAPIVIGKNVAIGPRVMIVTSTHHIGPSEWRAGAGMLTSRAVIIGDGVWIGAGAIILPGSVIEKGCVIAAGAVVAGTCAADQLWAGVPARAKSTLPS